MGGPGSGSFHHRRRPPKRPRVEDCLTPRMSFLRRHQYSACPACARGAIVFGDRASVGIETLITGEQVALAWLSYTTGREPVRVGELIS